VSSSQSRLFQHHPDKAVTGHSPLRFLKQHLLTDPTTWHRDLSGSVSPKKSEI
jgi:hypothetical protein